jgi:glutamate synthase (NADPH/NADH) large chain
MTGGRVLILGPTGRNVAAGMSGGVAHVLDLDPARVNHEMVGLAPLNDEEAALVQGLLREHAEETKSVLATDLLAAWGADADAVRARFTTVLPHDYRRVLEASARARAEGRDEIMAIMEASHG